MLGILDIVGVEVRNRKQVEVRENVEARETEEEDKTRKQQTIRHVMTCGWTCFMQTRRATPWATMWCVHKDESVEKKFRVKVFCPHIVEDDCVRSRLIKLQSFSLSKLKIDLVHRILVHFPLLLVRCKTWYGQIKLYWVMMTLMHGIYGCKECRLSVPDWILSSRYQSWICDGV